MSGAIFLSAGVPDPKRGPEFARTADSVAITAAVSALVHVALGRRVLVWGGHPAITPMVWVVAEALGVNYGEWVKLYQTRYFEDEFPEDNMKFNNVTYTETIDGDREKSLLMMRKQMFTDNRFEAGVFIGGMRGIIDEFDMFRKLQPEAKLLPIASTGGAVLELLNSGLTFSRDLIEDFDYVVLFHRHLSISVKESRFDRPHKGHQSIDNGFQKPEVDSINNANRVVAKRIITKMLVGESLVGGGNEVAHIDLLIGPRGSAAEAAFASALLNNKHGFTTLLAVIAPNLLAKPNTVLFNKVTIKGAKQAVQMFGPAQYGVARAVVDSVAEGVIPVAEADDLFISVGVFIHWDANDDKKIQDYNYEATKQAIARAIKGEPSPFDVVAQRNDVKHPLGVN
jgi:formaldehyde-activating enzyme